MGDMDSENSGSIQSSSTGGGDDHEYDSHGGVAASGSMLFNPMSCFNINTMPMPMPASNTTPLQLYSFNNGSSSSSSFSPHHQIGSISNFFDHPPPTLPLSSFHNNNNNDNNNNMNNNNQIDIGWPEKLGSIRQSISTDDTNCTEGPLGYSITNNNQQLQQNPNPSPSSLPLSGQGQGQGQALGPTVSLGSPRSSSALGSSRNPKKRSRASRRAPTTVLTTDTSNFRQMVQEFTGIPSPPFTAFSPRTRYDLFTGLTHSNSSTTMGAPSYLLRPFAQKISPQLPQSLQFSTHNSNPLSDVLGLGTAATPSASHTAAPAPAPAPSTNFELCDAQNYLTTNPQLSFQSLLQPSSSSHPTAQNSSSVNPVAGNYLGITSIPDSVAVNGVSNGGSTKGEGMVDSWICASD